MNNFKRGNSSTKSLGIGLSHVYREMWSKQMPAYYDRLKDYSSYKGFNYDWSQMNFESGILYFYSIYFDQKPLVEFEIHLEKLLEEFEEMDKREKEKREGIFLIEKNRISNYDYMKKSLEDFYKEKQSKTFWKY